MGLVNEVVLPGQCLKRAIEIAQLIAKFPQICMRNDRQAVYAGLDKALTEGLLSEASFGAQTIRSGEPLAGSYEFKSGKGRKGEFA